MTYFEAFIAPVPEANRDAYAKHSRKFAALAQSFGVERMIECWESDVPDGKLTDFRKAVDAKPGEKIVFSFFQYPSRAARDAANTRFRSDPEMAQMGSDMPFDGKRMIMGGFAAILDEGPGGGSYIDGIIAPVPPKNRDAYARMTKHNSAVFRDYGAKRVVDSLADDVAHGKLTDFYRAVDAHDEETIAFSFIEWADKPSRDAAWQRIMQEDPMQHGANVFDGKRMFWGGFEVILDSASATIRASVPLTA